MKNEKRTGRCLLCLLPILLAAALAAGLLLVPKREPEAERGDRTAEAAAPYLVEEESFFSDFAVKGDHVYFLCRLTVRNPSDTPVPVEISGDFSADAESGLILAASLPALPLDDGTGADFLALEAAEQEGLVRDLSGLLLLADGAQVASRDEAEPSDKSIVIYLGEARLTLTNVEQDGTLINLRWETAEGVRSYNVRSNQVSFMSLSAYYTNYSRRTAPTR